MRLTGDAARKWLEEHPNASYTNNKTGEVVQRQKSGIENLLLGISKPIRQIPSSILELGRGLEDLYDISQGGNATRSVGYRQKFNPEDYPGLTEEEIEDFKKDPTLATLKSGIGLISYGLPSGGGAATTTLGRIGSATAKGAISGAASGFALSDFGEEGTSVLKGAALGGLSGGALQGVSEGASALAKRVTSKSSKISDQAVKNLGVTSNTIDDVGGWSNAKDSASVFYNTADELKLPITTRYQKSDALNTMLGTYGDEVSNILSNSDATISIKNVLKSLDSSSKLKLAGLDDTSFINAVKEVLTSQGDEVSGIVAKDLISQLDDIAGGFSKISGDVSSQRNTIIKEIRNVLRTELGNAVPEVNSALAAQSSLLDIASDVYKQAGKTTTAYIPILGLKIQGNTALSSVADKIASAVTKTGTSTTSTTGQKLLGTISKLAQTGQNVSPQVAGLLGSQPAKETTSKGTSITDTAGTTQVVSNYTLQDGLVEAAQIFPNASESELLSLAQALVDQNSTSSSLDLNTTQSKYYSVADSAQGAINLLSSMASISGQELPGFGKTITSNIADLFNISDPQMLAYRNKISSIDLAVSNLISGTAISDNEAKRLKKLIPTMNDSVSEATSKLNELMQLGITGAGINNSSVTSDYESWNE